MRRKGSWAHGQRLKWMFVLSSAHMWQLQQDNIQYQPTISLSIVGWRKSWLGVALGNDPTKLAESWGIRNTNGSLRRESRETLGERGGAASLPEQPSTACRMAQVPFKHHPCFTGASALSAPLRLPLSSHAWDELLCSEMCGCIAGLSGDWDVRTLGQIT